MPAPLRLRLEQELREAVAERYEHARTPVERTNCQVVLLTDEGRTVTEIAWLVCRGRDQVRKIVRRFRSEGLAGLVPGKHTGRPLGVTPAWLAELERVIELDPHTVGVDRAVWTTRLLADYLERVTGHRTGIEAVRVHLHRLGYVCKRPTWSLKTQVDRTGRLGKKTPTGGGALSGCGIARASTHRRSAARPASAGRRASRPALAAAAAAQSRRVPAR
jgi:transposase